MILRTVLLLAFLSLQKTSENSVERLIFNEGFEKSFLNLGHWNYDLGNGCPELCGWGNKEFQFYTKENIFFER